MTQCDTCGATVLTGPGLTAYPTKDGKATPESKWYCHIPSYCLANARAKGAKKK